MPYKNEDQRKMAKAWRSKAWEKRREKLLAAHQKCEWCNGKSSQINHKRQGYYKGYELMLREEVDVICKKCHEHFTKFGTRRAKIFDSCTKCDAMIYPGRKTCYACGSKTISKKLSDLDPERRKRLIEILERCPDVHVDDVWISVWSWRDPIRVIGFEPQADLPWPMVKTTLGEVGLPAFMFGERQTRGTGMPWQDALKLAS